MKFASNEKSLKENLTKFRKKISIQEDNSQVRNKSSRSIGQSLCQVPKRFLEPEEWKMNSTTFEKCLV